MCNSMNIGTDRNSCWAPTGPICAISSSMEPSWITDVQQHGHWPIMHSDFCGCCNSSTAGLICSISSSMEPSWPIGFWWFAFPNQRCRWGSSKFRLLVWVYLWWSYRVNSLWPSDIIWCHRSGSTLTQVMACCLMAPSHYLKPCWSLVRFWCIHLRAISQEMHLMCIWKLLI